MIPLIKEFKDIQEYHGRPTSGLDDLQKAFEVVDQTQPGLSERLVSEIVKRLGAASLSSNEIAHASSRATG